MTEVLEESFSRDEFESSVIVRCGYSSCESCLRGKTKGEFLTVQKLDNYTANLFKFVPAIYGDDFGCCINDRRIQEIDSDETRRLYFFCVIKMYALKL
jgi:hypothetical protein